MSVTAVDLRIQMSASGVAGPLKKNLGLDNGFNSNEQFNFYNKTLLKGV